MRLCNEATVAVIPAGESPATAQAMGQKLDLAFGAWPAGACLEARGSAGFSLDIDGLSRSTLPLPRWLFRIPGHPTARSAQILAP
jgi:hypothetical protein